MLLGSSSQPLCSGVRGPSSPQRIPDSLYCSRGPAAPACHSHLLTGNWVFIRLPLRGRCNAYLTQLSRKMDPTLPTPLGYWDTAASGCRAERLPAKRKHRCPALKPGTPLYRAASWKYACHQHMQMGQLWQIEYIILWVFFDSGGMSGDDNMSFPMAGI